MYWYRRLELVVLTCILTAVFAAMSSILLHAASPTPRLLVVAAPTTVLRYSADGMTVPYKTQKVFDDWADGHDHMGAFAASAGGAWGRTTGFADIGVARDHAVALCQKHSKTPCYVVATMAPEGYHAYTGLVASSAFKVELLRYMSQEQFRALAVSSSGDWGRAWGYASPALAAAEALKRCQVAQLESTARGQPKTVCQLVRLTF